ncbi:MAG: hypothetical protein JRF33_09460 [Deltaproteobacteria bacterium]|nr:hypothetical protein [Deltaproteobacteria bacterium]
MTKRLEALRILLARLRGEAPPSEVNAKVEPVVDLNPRQRRLSVLQAMLERL